MPYFPRELKPSTAVVSGRHGLHETMSTSTDETQRDKIRVKNRRIRYLALHPEYFEESYLELADPLLYDRLVRRFKSAQEREQEGRRRGPSDVLEANLIRSEAKMEALRNPDPSRSVVYTRSGDGSITEVELDEIDKAQSREDGWQKWKDAMGQRFLRGNDEEFDYRQVDDSDDYDDHDEEDRDRLEAYLESEDEQFVGQGAPAGETGVQDY